MSGYVPNNRHIRKAPEPEPYNGNFDQQARRPMQTPPANAPQRMVGMRFIWDNGELLPPNIPYLLTADQGSPIRGGLDDRGSFIQQLQANHYEAQLFADVDVDTAVVSARKEMQAALDDILAAERAEAEKLRKEQEGRNVVVNYFHVRFAFGKGFFLGAWGMVKSLKEMSDLVNPFNTAWNMLASAWKAKATPQEGWYANFLNNYSAAQHEELVEALGFDPASITREKIAEAYETACFIYDDGPSKDILASFAVDYAKAQNIEEVAEFGGGAVFELVLAALLVIFTGGAGLAARGATSIRHAASLKRLGCALQRLSRTLKNAKIKLKGRGKGTGTGAQTVEVPRPKEIKAEKMEPPIVKGGSGPVPGTFGVSAETASVKGLQNYYPRQGSIEFVFDPDTSTFVVGRPNQLLPGYSPHENLAKAINANPSRVAGGMFSRGKAGEIFTNEFSGHYWQNWTPEVRRQFVDFMKSKGVTVLHRDGM
nr:polymorphic toxin type 43 domain-containing protein [uncultured Pseudomonas sp.]